jgi:mannonate dehydratase
MKIGLGLYRHMLMRDYYDFARQAGCTHVVVHLVDYFNKGASNPRNNQPTGAKYEPWGRAGDPEKLWTVEELKSLRREIEDAGLTLAAIENLDPAHWHDILLDGPQRPRQIENVKTIVRHMGEAGIPVLGYNFSLAGVCGRVTAPLGRGHAVTLGMDGPAEDVPIPNGMVWNMVYDPSAPQGTLPSISHEELWRRLQRFLEDIVPVAEQSGVRLAAHPDDPPMPTMRRQPRLVYQPAMYQRLIDLAPSPSNALELCVGTLAEMTEGDIYDAVDRYSQQGKIAYIHLRNVVGKVPSYRETFIDEGDVDMLRILTILVNNHFDGVVIPDHTPQMTCSAPWHAGMAHTIGFILAAQAMLKKKTSSKKSGTAPAEPPDERKIAQGRKS